MGWEGELSKAFFWDALLLFLLGAGEENIREKLVICLVWLSLAGLSFYGLFLSFLSVFFSLCHFLLLSFCPSISTFSNVLATLSGFMLQYPLPITLLLASITSELQHPDSLSLRLPFPYCMASGVAFPLYMFSLDNCASFCIAICRLRT